MEAQKPSKMATLVTVSVSNALLPFMSSGVGVALPTMGRDLGAGARQLGLVETAYFLSLSAFMLAAGRLGDIHGRRRVFQTGLALFALTGAAIAGARSIEAVIALRFLQGVGGAMMAATGMAIIVSVFPPNERGKALGINVATGYAGISCGPFLGGALVAAFGWRSLYALCLALGMATFALIQWRLREEWADAAGEPFDWAGSAAYAAAVGLLLFGSANFTRGLWAWGLFAAGLAGLGLFAAVELRTDHPVLDVRLLRDNRTFTLSSLATLLNYSATFAVTFLLSLYLQYVRGLSPERAGLLLMVQPVAQSLLSPLCGRLADRHPAERVATAGMALCSLGVGGAATLTATTPLPAVALLLVLLGVGFALFASPNNSVILGSVAPRHLGVASGLAGTMRTLGMMSSMTVVTVSFSVFLGSRAVTAETQPLFLRSMSAALLVFCGLCAVGIFCSLGRWRNPAPSASARAVPE